MEARQLELGRTASAARTRKEPMAEGILSAPARMLKAGELTDAEIERLAFILHQQWSEKERKDYGQYDDEMVMRSKNASTPFFVTGNGEIDGAIFPLRVSRIPKTWDQLTSFGTWASDEPHGKILVCPQIAVCTDAAPSSARNLIVNGVLGYARELAKESQISSFVAYSRPATFGDYPGLNIQKYLYSSVQNKSEPLESQITAYKKYVEISSHFSNGSEPISLGPFLEETGRRHIDQTIGMHLKFGAKIGEIIENGCPNDLGAGGYIVVMDYTHLL